jgi:hypothetical protein
MKLPGSASGDVTGRAIRIEYFDQNERFTSVLPRTAIVIKRMRSGSGVDNFFLVELAEPFDYEGKRHTHLVIRSRWRGYEIGEPEPTSVFVLLVPDPVLVSGDELDVNRLEHVSWGMAHTLPSN